MAVSRPNGPLRQQLLVDSSVQISVLCRTGLYVTACAVYFLVMLLFTESMSSPERNFGEAIMNCVHDSIYWAPGLLLLLPLVVVDILQVTNRFAGPIFRLRREMQLLARDQSERPLEFRDDDCWLAMAGEFNVLRDELMQLREYKRNNQPTSLESKPPVSSLFSHENVAGSDVALSID